MSDAPLITVENRDAVREICLNRPKKKNAFSKELADAFRGALRDAGVDPAVRCIVVRGAGDMFSAGIDLSVFQEVHAGDPRALENITSLHEAVRALRKPVIAAVHGKAIGMGVTLLPHFDMVYASDQASFFTPFVQPGLIVEFGGSFTLPRLVGPQRAREMIFRGRPLPAAEAERWGLVTRVFPHAALFDEVHNIASDVAAQPVSALLDCKALLARLEDADVEHAIEEERPLLRARAVSEENKAAIKAILTK